VTGDVTGSEIAEVCQQIHVSVMGCNILKHSWKINLEDYACMNEDNYELELADLYFDTWLP